MADTREQGVGGRAPIDPAPEFRGGDGPGVGDLRSVKVDMRQGPPPVQRQPERSGAAGGAIVLLSAALSLLCGGAGAWAYQRFLSRAIGEGPPASPTQVKDPEFQKGLAKLDDRIESLSGQYNGLSDDYKKLQARLESISKPAPPPDLAPLEEKVAQVGRLSQQVEAIEKRLDPLSGQIAQSENKIADLQAKVDDLHREPVSAARDRTPDRTPAGAMRDRSLSRVDHSSPGEGTESVAPPADRGASVDSTLESGMSRFREQRYKDAYDVFRRLLQSHQDDARVWYYAALS
jgi:chaperonin cofactor prefoldin